MNGLLFDLDFRTEKLEESMIESLGNQSIELESLVSDLERHIVKKTIPIDTQISMAVICHLTQQTIQLNRRVRALFRNGIKKSLIQESLNVYEQYHNLMSTLINKLYELRSKVGQHKLD